MGKEKNEFECKKCGKTFQTKKKLKKHAKKQHKKE